MRESDFPPLSLGGYNPIMANYKLDTLLRTMATAVAMLLVYRLSANDAQNAESAAILEIERLGGTVERDDSSPGKAVLSVVWDGGMPNAPGL